MTASSKCPVVGIGASAGGIEALEGFFKGLPAQPGFALVIVTHLNPERESILHEIVRRYTDLSVEIAADGVQVEQNQVYVLPADAILSIEKRRLIIRRNNGRRQPKPIDIFFSALAADVGELAAGVVLSGGDSDGTLGVKAIKACGGLTLAQVQNGFGPQHPDMPDSAIATGFIDFAIPVEEMGPKLAKFVHSSAMITGMDVGSTSPLDEPNVAQIMTEICGILNNQIGHDFSGYKITTFMRRVQRRMKVAQFNTVERYIEQLRQNPQEANSLFRDLLIKVTNFFRDAPAFEELTRLVMPKLFEDRGANETVRVWVPGCSTGEEVFSIAILLREQMDRLTAIPRVQVFATDIDDRALAVARAARYPAGLLQGVSEQRRERFFIPDGGSFVVSKEVRELCIFSPHSVIRDPPFSRIDLISCRNLLIYFGLNVQSRVIPTFHYALRPDGYLFLGLAENVSQFSDLFIPIEMKHRIFRRRADVAPRIRLPMMIGKLHLGGSAEIVRRRVLPLGGTTLRQAVSDQVAQQFAPAHVVINRDGDVLYYSERTGRYLEAPAGAPTRQLLTMARRDLRLDLRALFQEAVETGRGATRTGVSLGGSDDGILRTIDLTIEPLDDRSFGESLYLVLFADRGQIASRETLSSDHATHDRVAADMERELRETRDRLQSMVEEYETALEELKSSNEELVSVNEEMQSTNEELEASKEELQSVNEELQTVNTELHNKLDDLDRANSDLQNLFECTQVATAFLDKNLKIRSFTPSVTKVFNILPTDRGRPITDLSSRLSLTELADDITKVLSGQGPIERRTQTDDHAAHYLVRLAGYWNENKIEGVVVTFVDVTSLTNAEARQRVLIAELQHRTRNLLTVVQSIAQQTLGKGPLLETFSKRLGSLGRVQSVITSVNDEAIDLGDIVRMELQAIGATAVDGRITVAGPRVALSFDLIQTFGLALHELATNAVKYGALKGDTGRIKVTWDMRRNQDGVQLLILDWRESEVADIPEAPRRGFGRELIEKALVFTLRARSELTFGADGVSCHIEMPLPIHSDDSEPR